MFMTVYIIYIHKNQLIAKNKGQFFKNTLKSFVFIYCHADNAGILW